MKIKLLILSMLIALSFASSAKARVTAKDSAGYVTARTTTATALEQKKERLVQIHKRIEEIRNIDKSQLDVEQRKELRNELKTLRKEQRADVAAIDGPGWVTLAYVAILTGMLVVLIVVLA